MSRERNCCWHFDMQTGCDSGPNIHRDDKFSKNPYPSLIRESIQNSMDAVYDDKLPVIVDVNFKQIRVVDFKEFFSLKSHIQGCIDLYPDAIREQYGEMLTYFSSSYSHKLDYIEISDSNTTGMWYQEGKIESPFYAFVRSKGVSSKTSSAAGGSFGFGKSAYFNISPIRTLMVSTLTTKGQYVFEGVSSLCTHIIGGKKYTSVGYYDNNRGNPITDADEIPTVFKRTAPGTSFSIMGFDMSNYEEAKEGMIQSVIQNFWMAILRNKLKVRVDNIEINRDNLGEMMKLYFSEEEDCGKQRNKYNPRPYYESVMHCVDSKSVIFFSEVLPLLGEVELYINQNHAPHDRIIYMRKPLMHVFAENRGTHYGFNGLFICCSDKGNELLRKLENAQHNEWNTVNWKERGKTAQIAKDVFFELQTFVKEKVESVFLEQKASSTYITGLEEFLYIPEQLINQEGMLNEQKDIETLFGQPAGASADDGPIIQNEINQNNFNNDTKCEDEVGHIVVAKVGNAYGDSEGDTIAGTGHSKKTSRQKGGNPMRGQEYAEANINLGDGDYLEYIPVNYRVIAQIMDGNMRHIIKIYSPRATEYGEIDLAIGGEQTEVIPEIIETSDGIIQGNKIVGLRIQEGKNELNLRLADSMKHAIILKTYERR